MPKGNRATSRLYPSDGAGNKKVGQSSMMRIANL